ncbi:MAG TPA: hypothetical protein VND93_03365 [Myxococcales bacterium]|nr:hypothetical protein [Myxococcales bacterium]
MLCALLVAGCPRRAETRGSGVAQPTDPGRGGGPGSRPDPNAGAVPVGTGAPFFVLATAPDGRWVVACQAREDTDGSGAIDARVREDGTFAGDDLVPYLFRPGLTGDPSGEALVALIASSHDGRWLAIQGAEGLWLLDTLRESRARLEDASPSASFDRLGEKVAYVKKVRGKLLAAVRNLETGQEQLVDPGPGALRAVRLDADGEMLNLFLDVPPIEPPRATPARRPRHPAPPPPPPPPPRPVCPSPAERASPPVEKGAAIHRVMLLPDGKPIEVPGLVRTLGRAILRRGERGELLVQDAQGFEVEWVPHDCGARLLQVDPARELVLVACDGAAGDRPWSEVELHGTRVHKALGLEVLRGGADAWLNGRPRLFEVPKTAARSGKQEHLLRPGWVDLDRKVALPWEGQLLWSEGGRALARAEDGRLWLADVDLEVSAPVDAPRPGTSPLVAGSPFAAMDGVVMDVREQAVLGEYPGLALALDRAGRVLVSTDPRGWGPARWMSPVPPAR